MNTGIVNLTIKYWYDDNYARIDLLDSSNNVVGSGYAKRDNHDPVVPLAGYELALSRAFKSASDTCSRSANTKMEAVYAEKARERRKAERDDHSK